MGVWRWRYYTMAEIDNLPFPGRGGGSFVVVIFEKILTSLNLKIHTLFQK